MDPSTQVIFELPSALRIYADGHLERLDPPKADPGLDPTTKTTSKDVTVNSDVGARIYIPESAFSNPNPTKLPVLVYYHGGGFISGSVSEPDTHNYLNTLAARAHVLIVSVEYRLAPENPIPIPYEDSWAAYEWVANCTNEIVSDYGDLSRVFLAGESAGANIAHHMALRVGAADREGEKKVVGLVLVYPLFWGAERMECEREADAEGVLQPEQLDGGLQLVCGGESEVEGEDPRFNPLAKGAAPLTGLGCEKVLVCVGGRDLLRGRGRAYYERLCEVGWVGTAEFVEAEGEDHGFHLAKPECEKALELMDRVVCFVGGRD